MRFLKLNMQQNAFAFGAFARRLHTGGALQRVAVLARKIRGHGPMASAVARAYNEVWDRAPNGVWKGQILS